LVAEGSLKTDLICITKEEHQRNTQDPYLR